MKIQILWFLFFNFWIITIDAAAWVVAASNSIPSAKSRADIICNGTDDQIALSESMKKGPWTKTEYDDNAYTFAYSAQSVEWLPGDYYLSDTLFVPQYVDSVIHAEGAIFHYGPSSGDAIVFTGSLRCRYYLGTIWTGSSGAALAFKDRPYANPFMPNNMNVIQFQGLQHDPPSGNNGIGLHLTKHFCVNKVEGTDIRGFDIGVYVDDNGEGKVDTNWYWLSYVRGCGVDILVEGVGVDSQQWFVNVDATLSGSVAIKTAALYERWQIIMGTLDRTPNTRSIILDPGAQWNWMEITPPLWNFDGYENNSGYPNNVFSQIPSNLGNKTTTVRKRRRAGDPSHQVLVFQNFVDGQMDAKQALQTCQDLYNEGLITMEEYSQKRREIIDQI